MQRLVMSSPNRLRGVLSVPHLMEYARIRIVSGSSDYCTTIRLSGDAETGNASTFKPLQGRSEDVNSIAFSPDGTRIISGSVDIRLSGIQALVMSSSAFVHTSTS
ncbi:hypothetical protein PILCRDRAFT_257478 [Piloderma croceum F 1598]|uniref:Uncharacterized protein n=1 Tax=Piloderma croceum (strain F 1598) TaxID=765440 RepID=A0A0C3FVH6_PILCF|nr:hypothetical protein PILCRDRAFT_257478 [Piloderma croceum F 1598]